MEALLPATAIDSGTLIQVPTELITSALDLIENSLEFEGGYSFDWEACRAAVEYFSRIIKGPGNGNCWVAAMTGRTLGRMRANGLRYSNAPHTYQDRALVRSVDGDLPVMLLFRQEGREEDGWRGTPFWWPVLFSPANAKPSVFASTIRPEIGDDEDDEESA